jgi:hypothetical protein
MRKQKIWSISNFLVDRFSTCLCSFSSLCKFNFWPFSASLSDDSIWSHKLGIISHSFYQRHHRRGHLNDAYKHEHPVTVFINQIVTGFKPSKLGSLFSCFANCMNSAGHVNYSWKHEQHLKILRKILGFSNFNKKWSSLTKKQLDFKPSNLES